MRTHVSLPDDLVREVDAVAGNRRRSAFIEEAVREKVLLERQRRALLAVAGSLKEANPEWSTPEAVSAWVRKSRDLDNARLEEILKHYEE